jgi:hypothetical protein
LRRASQYQKTRRYPKERVEEASLESGGIYDAVAHTEKVHFEAELEHHGVRLRRQYAQLPRLRKKGGRAKEVTERPYEFGRSAKTGIPITYCGGAVEE